MFNNGSVAYFWKTFSEKRFCGKHYPEHVFGITVFPGSHYKSISAENIGRRTLAAKSAPKSGAEGDLKRYAFKGEAKQSSKEMADGQAGAGENQRIRQCSKA